MLHAATGNIYQWSLNGTNISGATAATYTAHTTGNYSVLMTNSYNCSVSSTTVPVTVSAVPSATIANIGGYLHICSNDSVVLGATFGSNSAYTYQWQQNGNSIPGATYYAYAARAAGNYSLVVSNNDCMVTSAPLTVTTWPAPADTLLNVTTTVLCPGGQGITINGGIPGSAEKYLWYMNGLSIPSAYTSTYLASMAGSYALRITDTTNGCSAFSKVAIITPGNVPVPVINYQWPNFTTQPFSTYQWYLNGTPINGATVATYSPTQRGAYTLQVTDANGCTGTSANYYFAYSGLNNIATAASIKVYPNPTHSILYIDAAIPVKATLYEVDGRVLMSTVNSKQLDISTLDNGVYLLSVTDGNDRVINVSKVVKN